MMEDVSLDAEPVMLECSLDSPSESPSCAQEQLRDEAAALFAKADVDSNGSLSHSELKKEIQKDSELRERLSATKWKTFFSEIDSDGDGMITQEEFVVYYTKHCAEGDGEEAAAAAAAEEEAAAAKAKAAEEEAAAAEEEAAAAAAKAVEEEAAEEEAAAAKAAEEEAAAAKTAEDEAAVANAAAAAKAAEEEAAAAAKAAEEEVSVPEPPQHVPQPETTAARSAAAEITLEESTEMFHLYDEDGSGSVDTEELLNMVAALKGKQLESLNRDKVLEVWDPNDDGQVVASTALYIGGCYIRLCIQLLALCGLYRWLLYAPLDTVFLAIRLYNRWLLYTTQSHANRQSSSKWQCGSC